MNFIFRMILLIAAGNKLISIIPVLSAFVVMIMEKKIYKPVLIFYRNFLKAIQPLMIIIV